MQRSRRPLCRSCEEVSPMKDKLRRILWIAAAVVLVINGALFAAGRLQTQYELTDATEVHFIDVGQGDAALLLSGGQAVLIDAGTAESASALVRYLEERGVRSLYAVIASHPHSDHIGGMAAVLSAFPAEHFYMGPETQNTAAYEDMLDALEAQGVQHAIPADGDTLRLDSGATVTFLGPADDVSAENMNDRSLIALFSTGAEQVLFMGDAEAAAEQSLLAHHPELTCDILKVGHHGSDTSTSAEFLSFLTPEYCVISCDDGEEYDHPSSTVMNRLFDEGVVTYRTNRQGDIVLLIDRDGGMAFKAEHEVPVENNTDGLPDLMLKTKK